MRREELIMDILGGLDERLIEEAMPDTDRYSDSYSEPRQLTLQKADIISKKELCRSFIAQLLGMAAAALLVVGTIVLLWQNWDKIAVRDPDKQGAVTSENNNNISCSDDDIIFKYDGCTLKVLNCEFDGLTAKITYDLIFDKNPGWDLQPHVSPSISDICKEFTGKPHKLIKKDGLVYTWESTCTQYEPSSEMILTFKDHSWDFDAPERDDDKYKLAVGIGNVPARVFETNTPISCANGVLVVKNVNICESTVTVKCLSSGLTDTQELEELKNADISIIMSDGTAVSFVLEPNTVNPVMKKADNSIYTARFIGDKIDTSMIKTVSINGTTIFDTETYALEQITDTSMPEPYAGIDSIIPSLRKFSSPWQRKFGGAYLPPELDLGYFFPEKSDILYSDRPSPVRTPYKLDNSCSDLYFARLLGLSDYELKDLIYKRQEIYLGDDDYFSRDELLYTDEDIEILLSGDNEQIARHFASEYSIVVGENVFCPEWLYLHTAEDYKAAGITPNDVFPLLEKYKELGITEEMWRALRRKLIIYAYSETYPEKDRVYTYETDVSEPLGDRAFEIFENVFYGKWTLKEKMNGISSAYLMTYGESSFIGGLYGIYETDELYVMDHNDGGGVLECCVIEKSDPDVMYITDVLPTTSGINEIKLGDDERLKYADREPVVSRLQKGVIGSLGLTYLKHIYGSDFEAFFNSITDRDSYNSISEDEKLFLGNRHTIDNMVQYLIDMSENSVVLALPYVRDTQSSDQSPVYYKLSFEKDKSGEWSVKYSELPLDSGELNALAADDRLFTDTLISE